MNSRLGDRSFTVTGPRLWNTLSAELRQPDIELVTFRQLLKPICLTVSRTYSTSTTWNSAIIIKIKERINFTRIITIGAVEKVVVARFRNLEF